MQAKRRGHQLVPELYGGRLFKTTPKWIDLKKAPGCTDQSSLLGWLREGGATIHSALTLRPIWTPGSEAQAAWSVEWTVR